jgi:hypothetical protein
LGMKKADVSFLSEISGRILYNIDQGMPLWSLIRSSEDLRLKESRTAVQGCVTSRMKTPEAALTFLSLPENLTCKPKAKGVAVPF